MSHYLRGFGYLVLASAGALYLGLPAFCAFWVWLLYGNYCIERALKNGHIRQGRFDSYVVGSLLWPVVVHQLAKRGNHD